MRVLSKYGHQTPFERRIRPIWTQIAKTGTQIQIKKKHSYIILFWNHSELSTISVSPSFHATTHSVFSVEDTHDSLLERKSRSVLYDIVVFQLRKHCV